MKVDEEQLGNVMVLAATGRLDSNTSRAFEEQLLGQVDSRTPYLVVDCAGLDYVSSAGLRVLLKAAKQSKAAKTRLALCALQPQVREVFDISGFSSIFAIHDDRPAAIAAESA